LAETLEEQFNASQRRLAVMENLKDTEKQIILLEQDLGISAEAFLKRLENKKLELTALTEFLSALNTEADKVDAIEIEILKLLKAKLKA
jgi:nicotinic acid phosphoribosyltransferase